MGSGCCSGKGCTSTAAKVPIATDHQNKKTSEQTDSTIETLTPIAGQHNGSVAPHTTFPETGGCSNSPAISDKASSDAGGCFTARWRALDPDISGVGETERDERRSPTGTTTLPQGCGFLHANQVAYNRDISGAAHLKSETASSPSSNQPGRTCGISVVASGSGHVTSTVQKALLADSASMGSVSRKCEEQETVPGADSSEDNTRIGTDTACNSDKGSFFCSSSTSIIECCNDKCIMAVAVAECFEAQHTETRGSLDNERSRDNQGKHPQSACSLHLEAAFAKYSTYLETAKCICRSVLDRGLRPSCCTATRDNSQAQQLSRAADPKRSATSINNVCKSQQSLQGSNCCQQSVAPSKPRSSSACCPSNSCGSKETSEDTVLSITSTPQSEPLPRSCCRSDSCKSAASSRELPGSSKSHVTSPVGDIEKGSELEHVSLTVQGMTCSGCATKLTRVMDDAITGVSNVSVNFVTGSADFDVDASATSSDDIVRIIEKATGFHCTVVRKVDQFIDLLISPGPSLIALQTVSISGLLQVSLLNKRVVRVGYDPTLIGARTLLEKFGEWTDGLAPPPEDPSLENGRKRLRDMLLKTLAAWILTIPVLVLAWGQLSVTPNIRAGIQFALATLVQLIAIPEFYRPAVSALIYSGMVEMDMLIVISITAAYLYSVVAFGFRLAGAPLETPEFFETSTLLITLVVFSRLVAAYARIRAVVAVSMRSLQPTTAMIITSAGEKEIDARLLQFGDKFRVYGDSKIPTDGHVIGGTSEVDESMITGENTPVVKGTGMDVIAGTRNIWGAMIVQPTRLPGHNTVTDIADMVEQAAKNVPKIQSLADRVASYFVPAVSGIAVAVFAVWIIICVKVRDEAGGQATAHAITYAIAVLAISCPCGIGLAVPMVLVIAGGIAARAGVIIKSADSTERARKTTDVLFDKTGTLTEAELDVVSVDWLCSDKSEAAGITSALVQANKHPVSVAIAKHLGEKHSSIASDIRVVPGSGVEGVYGGATIRGGSPQWTRSSAHPSVTALLDHKLTIFCVSKDTDLLAVFGLKTRIRQEAASVVDQLQQRGITVHLVSGDNTEAVNGVAVEVGIPLSRVAASCTPAKKRDYVAALMAGGKTVMFCGDGTNDAVAVVQADVGVQISGGKELAARGSEVTRGAADVVLLAGLHGIPFLIDISRAAYRRMVFNFVWSGVYNLLAILMTSGAFVTFRIPPAYAGLGEVVSILPVILAAVTLLAVRTRV